MLPSSVRPDSGGGARRSENTEYWSNRKSEGRSRDISRDRDSNYHGRHGGRKDQDEAGRENQGYEGDPPETPHDYRDYRDDYAASEGSGDGGEDPRDRSRGSRRSGSARSDIQVFRKFRLKVQEIVNYFSTDWQRDDKDIRVAYCKQGEQCYKQLSLYENLLNISQDTINSLDDLNITYNHEMYSLNSIFNTSFRFPEKH